MRRSGTILIYRTGQLGDSLVSLPAIQAIRDAYPESTFILLTDRQPNSRFVSSWDLFRSLGIFSEVLFYTPPTSLAGWVRSIGLAIRIRRRKPDAAFFIREFSRNYRKREGFFFQLVCGVKRCYGLGHQGGQVLGRRDASGKLVTYPKEVDYYLDLVRSWGLPAPESGKATFDIQLSGSDRAHIDSLWKQENIPENAIVVGIGPGSKMPAKRWPLERFIEVGRDILASFPESRLMVFGGTEDVEYGREMQRVLGPQVINTAGKLSVFESAEGLRRCRLYVGNDTGTMHIAAAVETPCVVIFSARDHPGRWDPYGTQHTVLRVETPCSGCMLQSCMEHDLKCLKEITVTDVMAAVAHNLEKPEPAAL